MPGVLKLKLLKGAPLSCARTTRWFLDASTRCAGLWKSHLEGQVSTDWHLNWNTCTESPVKDSSDPELAAALQSQADHFPEYQTHLLQRHSLMWQPPQVPTCSFLRCATPWIASEETKGLAEPRGRAGRARPVPRRDCSRGASPWPGAQLLSSQHRRLGQGQIHDGTQLAYYRRPTFLALEKMVWV